MFVKKRDGTTVEYKKENIIKTVDKLSKGLVLQDCKELVIDTTCEGLHDNVTTTEITELLSSMATNNTFSHPDYGILGGRLSVLNLHKSTTDNLKEYADTLYNYVNPKTNLPGPLLTEATYNVFIKHKSELEKVIDYNRDFNFTSFGIHTLLKSYLIKINEKVFERPQQLYMRVAIGIHEDDIHSVIKTYEYLSKGLYTHATPTMFHSGTPHGQLSSCFLMSCEDDLKSIFEGVSKFALVSKGAGGAGMTLSDIRAKSTYISGTNGESNGIEPLMRVYNQTTKYVDQGGNKRPGALALYIEPWHSDVIDFLKSVMPKHRSGDNLNKNIFLGLMVPDLFMRRALSNDKWSLMCPHQCKGLTDCYGKEFEDLYMQYEAEGKYIKQIPAQKLFELILECQFEKGLPYILFKDACNEKSNQKNLGTMKCSNLCTEITQYNKPGEEAVCNLASIALTKCIVFDDDKPRYDFDKLHEVAEFVTKNLNKVIDVTKYPLAGAKKSNLKHRPMGIGVQGLADVYAIMRMPYESDEAKMLNKRIFETIYHGALEASMKLSKEFGPYESYEGSPVSKGILQFDMWGVKPTGLWNWDKLKKEIKINGIRNSLLTALMPTASTAQILGNSEAFYPYLSCAYTRKVNSGQFQIINRHLVNDLIKLKLWDDDMKNKIINAEGSIQNIDEIPNDIKMLYKATPEMSNRILNEMSADRGPFIDQSQSHNIHINDKDTLVSCIVDRWKKGSKTGNYYIYTNATTGAKVASSTCSRNGDCISCSS